MMAPYWHLMVVMKARMMALRWQLMVLILARLLTPLATAGMKY
jgi:hypothetical protein